MADTTSFAQVPDDAFRLIVESAPNAIVMVDQEGKIILVNPQAELMFGYGRSELIGQAVEILVPNRHESTHREDRNAYLANPKTRAMGAGRDLFGLRKDGSEFPVEIGLSPLQTEQGRFVLSAIVDITERKRIELALAEREQFLQTIFDTEPECVKLLAPGGILLKMNRAGVEMLEADSADQLIGHCVYPMVLPEHREAFKSLTERVFRGESGTLEFGCLGRKGTRRTMEMHAVPLRGENDQITAVLGITRDITDKRTAEQRARQAERLATIGQVVAGLAHESRNALQRSQAALELLELEVEDNQEATVLVGRIQKAQDHLRHLFDEVRNYAAPIKLDCTDCTLPEIWREAWSLLAPQRYERSATLHEEDGGLDLSCRVDRFRLVQVFRNLLENALAACADPVHISITCRQRASDVIEVSVRDNGPGLESEAQRRVFEPFFTTKTKGTGLGMAIVARIIDAHHGKITLAESEHPGAEFLIQLPRATN